jgi:uncharacterized protein
MAVAAAPLLATGERMDVLDAVRGVAVLGILTINIVTLSGYGFSPPVAAAGSRFDAEVFFALLFLIEGKFYALFSFLFGVGFAVFVQRAAARGANPAHLFTRRLAGLLLIGFVHSVFIWMGDILMTYAVLGFGLVPFLRKSDRTVMRWAVSMLLLPVALYGLALAAVMVAGITAPPAPAAPAAASPLPPILEQAVQKFRDGGYVDVVEGNAVFTAAQIARRLVLMFFPRVFGMFLLGFLAGRHNLFAELTGHRRLLMRLLAAGLLLGLPLAWTGAYLEQRAVAVPNALGLLETIVKSISIPVLSLGYAAGLCLLFLRARAVMAAFAPVGRMALTNYLAHSVVGVIVFYGIGFGLFGEVSLAVALTGAIGFFLLQMVVSRIWLTYALFGPAEWVWRMLTYGSRFPLLHKGR